MSFRSFRRKDSEYSLDSSAPTRSNTFASGTTLVSKASTVFDDGGGDSKGALGLNLLYSPSKVDVDFVFVHGLGGGSRKTWSKTSSVTHFWPQEWLPKDPAFRNVRIHSYGYNSDWARSKENVLNIHHIGKSFLGELETSPCLCTSKTFIVLIGHSMGGLVIKQAYILSRQSGEQSTISRRIHSIFFLATPHRGSGSAKFLSNILQVARSQREYVADLQIGSSAIQSINDEFRQYATDVHLRSFYETQKLQMGLVGILIVDPNSAVLGYPQEIQMPVNADHRSICKFDTPFDPNFKIIRNALELTVNEINSIEQTEETSKATRSRIKDIANFLRIPDDFENDLITSGDARLDGTCEWVAEKDNFREWRDSDGENANVLWITGQPASGKSVIAGYVVHELRRTNSNCSFFFFKHGDRSKSRLTSCLSSIVYQMAMSCEEVRNILLRMLDENIDIHRDNERLMWHTLFSYGIFQARISKTYWILDALDECANIAPFVDTMLAKVDRSIPLRVLITSRETPELKELFGGLGKERVRMEQLSVNETIDDIRLLVESKAKSLPTKSEDDRDLLKRKIVEKSRGSFLWTVLVLKELSCTHSEEEVAQVLEEVPRGMSSLYERTLESMSTLSRSKQLAMAILTWVSSAIRPLTTKELGGAIRSDIAGTYPNIEESIVALCGQLVVIDKFKKVHMIHETAREFLTDQNLSSEFAIKKNAAHTRIAKACLVYMNGEDMKPPRIARRGPAQGKRAEFAAYACVALSYHLTQSDPSDVQLLKLLYSFLGSNILSWIEFMAQTGSLNPLIQAANHIRAYYNMCVREHSPLGNEMQIIKLWSTDLIRISARFSEALLTSPSAIFSIIIPFCPSESAISKAPSAPRRLSVQGNSDTQWDDRLSCIDFPDSQASAITYGEDVFGVGLTNGLIKLYYSTSCQELKTLDHGEAVKHLCFKVRENTLASCGIKTIRVWNISTGEITRTFKAPHRVLHINFDGQKLLAASYRSYLASWSLENGETEPTETHWARCGGDSAPPPTQQPPCAISISVEQVLAVAYAGQPILLWDMVDEVFLGTCGKRHPDGNYNTHMITSLVFNPNPAIGLLAATYLDGELVIVDPFNDQEVESHRAECHTLAASPDGRFLAGAAASGVIKIYEFDTLKLLYTVKSKNSFVKQIIFSNNSLQFLDIRGSQCNVWEPAVLLKSSTRDDSSEATFASLLETVATATKAKIDSLVVDSKDSVVFCGKSNGSVGVYDMKDGKFLKELYRHKSQVRTTVWWQAHRVLMTTDASNVIQGFRLSKSPKGEWSTKEVLTARLDSRVPITHLLLDEQSDNFLASTRESDHLWSIAGHEIQSRSYSNRDVTRKWISHPHMKSHLICIDTHAVHLYTWANWTHMGTITLSPGLHNLQLKNIINDTSSRMWRIILDMSELNGSAVTQGLYLLDIHNLDKAVGPTDALAISAAPSAEGSKPTGVTMASLVLGHQLSHLTEKISHILGLGDGARLIFMDDHSWICSVNLSQLTDGIHNYSRHFFVPYDWFSGSRDIVCALEKRDIVLTRNGDVLIIKNWSTFEEKVELDVLTDKRLEGRPLTMNIKSA